MTVKKAIEILDYYTEKKSEMKAGLLDRNKPWNHGDVNLYPLSEIMADNIETDLLVLNAIRKQIEPNCKHTEKSQDIDPDGNRYCVDCNLDL